MYYQHYSKEKESIVYDSNLRTSQTIYIYINLLIYTIGNDFKVYLDVFQFLKYSKIQFVGFINIY